MTATDPGGSRARTCIVTGAGQGIGRALALDFAAHGHRVVLAEKDPRKAEAVACEIAAAGGTALPVETDITDPASVRAMAARALERFGRADILVSNARWSGLVPTPVQEITDEDWRRAYDVNVTGAFNCVRALVPPMIEAGWGRILVLSSSTIRLPPARPYVHYITTKAALVGMVRALARELGPHGITANAILPGSVETGADRPGQPSAQDRAARAREGQSIPRVSVPADLLGLARFLASDDSAFVTGQSISVDGGRTFG